MWIPAFLILCQNTLTHIILKVFELLDHDGGGTINSEELYNSLKDLDIGIKREEIDFVLQELDNDGNGEIDFDEFLYAMSMTDKYIDQLTGNIFFSAQE